MTVEARSRGDLVKAACSRLAAGVLILWAVFFLPAGTLAYWEAWAYSAVIIVPMLFAFAYLLRHSPELLERRLRMKEKEPRQRRIVAISYPFYVLAFMLPGLDRRFDWSSVPVAAVLGADVLVMIGYGVIFLALRENSHASRIVEVEPGQKVVTSGPYAVVRHPLYLGVLLMHICTPPALGSWWAMIPALLIVPVLVARIGHEESLLERDLEGYREYRARTRYRLVPGLW